MTAPVPPGPPPATTTRARAFFVSGFGTALEFYDFIIYGLAAAIVFPRSSSPPSTRRWARSSPSPPSAAASSPGRSAES